LPRLKQDGSPAAAAKKRKLTDLKLTDLKLTDLMNQRLAAKDQPYLIWATVQRGLALRVQPKDRSRGAVG
jgi:hypothetical protein